jgi:hypothetical protein
MKKWKVLKYILLTVLLVFGIALAIFAYQVYDHTCWFIIEDNVAYSYGGVIISIEKYIKENHEPPETLSIVPPGDMEDVRQMKEIVKTDYYVIPERNAWKLDVLVRARGKERQFVYVSDGILTPEEKERYYVWCHDWVVLRKP